jgi:hypothetical protein
VRPRKHNPMCPTHGEFKGGALDGQRYAFLGVEVTPGLNTLLHLRVSDGVWPFPRDMAVPLEQLYGVLFTPIKGDRARRFNIDGVMEAAHVAHYEAVSTVGP